MKNLVVTLVMLIPFLVFAQEATTNEEDAQRLFSFGKTELGLKNYDAAIEKLNRAIELNDTISDYYMWLGLSYKEKLQQASHFEKGILGGKALDNYKKAVKLDPANIEARIHLANYYIHAPSISGGSNKKARVQADEINKYDPLQGVSLMVSIYMNEEEYDSAIGALKKYIELDPSDPDAFYTLGRLYQETKRFSEATAMFEKAFMMDDKAYGSLYQIGRTAVFSGENLERGIESLQEYIKVNPGSPNPGIDAAHWRLGMLYEQQGEVEFAKDAYKHALQLNPEEVKYKKALAKFD